MNKKTIFSFAILSSLLISLTASANEINFSDIPQDHEFNSEITKLVSQGCITGYEDNTFQPDKSVARVEAVKMLLSCIDLPEIYSEKTIKIPQGAEVTFGNNTSKIEEATELVIKIPFNANDFSDLEFQDIQNDQWYVPYLKEAVYRGLIKGYNDGTIKPSNSVTKGELFTMLYRLTPEKLQEIQTEEPLSNDIASGYWFYSGLQMALENNLIKTDGDNNINPSKELSRGEIANYISDYIDWIDARTEPENTQPTEEETTTEEPAPEEETTESNQTNDETTTNQIKTEGFEVGYQETGIASYYGASFDGARTASGTLLDTASYMAAHKYLPFGTIVRVTDPDTTKWVEVTIVDRGPFVEGRVIDLTPSAFEDLGFPLSKGIAKVELEVISLPSN